jgi:hypothetical protein
LGAVHELRHGFATNPSQASRIARRGELRCGDSGGGAGLGSYSNLVIAADYVAQNLHGGLYPQVVADLAASDAPGTTATAIIDSPWSCGHYSGSTTCNTNQSQWGAAFHHGSVGSYAAPASDW